MNREEIKMLDHIICEVEKCIKNNNVSKDTMFCIPLGASGSFGYITYDMLLNFKKIQQQNKKYKEVIDKAIEYIKIYRSYQKIDNKDYLKGRDEIGCLDICQVDELLNILKEVE